MDTMNTKDFFTIFIFPFKYEMKGNKQLKPDEVAQRLSKGNTDGKSGWAIAHYALDSIKNYNEFSYFHPYVQRAIFNKEGNVGVEFLKREDFHTLKLEYYDSDNMQQTMETQVNEIDIHLFDNQIGLLTITTEKQHGDSSTIDFQTFLRYNDIARRVYPPYLGEKNICSPKLESKILPVKISLCKGSDTKYSISEAFKPIDLEESADKDIVFLSNIIKELLTPFVLKHTYNMPMVEDTIYYTPFIDDRMFIVSYYSDNAKSAEMQARCCDGYVYETSDDWYRFIFVDGNYANIKNDAMKNDLIRRHTYARWANNGSFFGMSRYSFVLLCDDSNFSRNVLKQHMKSLYYQIALIVLFQRAMLLKFAEDIDGLTGDYETGKCLKKLKDDSGELHGKFIKFVNKYWFIEVTPQEQGIEIYNQWMELLNLEKLYNELQREISELAGYVENKIEAETNNRVAMITYMGPLFLILGVAVTIYGDDIRDAKSWIGLCNALCVLSSPAGIIFILLCIVFVVTLIYFLKFIKSNITKMILWSIRMSSKPNRDKMVSWFKGRAFQWRSPKEP